VQVTGEREREQDLVVLGHPHPDLTVQLAPFFCPSDATNIVVSLMATRIVMLSPAARTATES